ncbi:hypothetical protein MRB53_036848 [Persea americana]|nr:hypothetical protein MRB53_036848 [Persea americana]
MADFFDHEYSSFTDGPYAFGQVYHNGLVGALQPPVDSFGYPRFESQRGSAACLTPPLSYANTFSEGSVASPGPFTPQFSSIPHDHPLAVCGGLIDQHDGEGNNDFVIWQTLCKDEPLESHHENLAPVEYMIVNESNWGATQDHWADPEHHPDRKSEAQDMVSEQLLGDSYVLVTPSRLAADSCMRHTETPDYLMPSDSMHEEEALLALGAARRLSPARSDSEIVTAIPLLKGVKIRPKPMTRRRPAAKPATQRQARPRSRIDADAGPRPRSRRIKKLTEKLSLMDIDVIHAPRGGHVCEECGRRFRRREHLQRHFKVIHLGEGSVCPFLHEWDGSECPEGDHACCKVKPGVEKKRGDNLDTHIQKHIRELVEEASATKNASRKGFKCPAPRIKHAPLVTLQAHIRKLLLQDQEALRPGESEKDREELIILHKRYEAMFAKVQSEQEAKRLPRP